MFWFRRVFALTKDDVIVVSQSEHSEPLESTSEWMKTFADIKRLPGPRFPDGSINWQCPCMAGGSLVAHRCGNFFRKLYICMSENDHEDVTVKCPGQFVDWSGCMQNMSEERKNSMRQALRDENEPLGVKRN